MSETFLRTPFLLLFFSSLKTSSESHLCLLPHPTNKSNVRAFSIPFFLGIELDKSSSDVAAEGAILNEMLDIVAKRAALRSHENTMDCDVSVVNSKAHSIKRSNFYRSNMFGLCLQFVFILLCTYLFYRSI